MLGEPLEVLVPLRYARPMELSGISPPVYQFRVFVQGISPLIWRRFSIRGEISLATLHATWPILFGWSAVQLHDCRLHSKEYGGARVGAPHVDDDPCQVPRAALHLHRLRQIRTRVVKGDWAATCREWSPGFRAAPQPMATCPPPIKPSLEPQPRQPGGEGTHLDQQDSERSSRG